MYFYLVDGTHVCLGALVCVDACEHGGQRDSLGCPSSRVCHVLFERGSFTGPRLIDSAGLHGQRAPESCLYHHHLQTWGYKRAITPWHFTLVLRLKLGSQQAPYWLSCLSSALWFPLFNNGDKTQAFYYEEHPSPQRTLSTTVSSLEMQNTSQRELRVSVSSGHQQSRLVALIHIPTWLAREVSVLRSPAHPERDQPAGAGGGRQREHTKE